MHHTNASRSDASEYEIYRLADGSITVVYGALVCLRMWAKNDYRYVNSVSHPRERMEFAVALAEEALGLI